MTLSFRNGLLTLLTVLVSAFFVFFVLAVFFAQQRYGWDAVISVETQPLFWFWSVPAPEVRLYQVIFETGIAPPIALVGMIYLRQVYRKTTAAEIFFFAVFFTALAAEALRIVQVFLFLENQPFFYSAALTRVIWAFRFFGLFTLFCGSLYALPFTYKKYGNLVGICFILSLILAGSLPIQTTVVQSTLLFSLSDEKGIGIFFILLSLIVVGNILIGFLTNSNERTKVLFISTSLFLVGWQGVFFGWSVLSVFLIPAIILLGRKTQETYLWN